MKKSVLIVGIIFIMLSSILFSALVLGKDEAKASSQVIKELQDNGKVRVIVTLKNNELNSKGNLKSSALNERKDVVEIIGKGRVKHEFQSFNGFSATLTEEEIEELGQDDRVESVVNDAPVHAFLTDSVGIVNATTTWPIQINGINLTGRDETVCIIDTGVNYTHESLGGCQIVNLSLEGNIENLTTPIESSHPYADNYDYTWNITMPGFSKIAVHFVNISTETHFDYIIIYDRQNNTIGTYFGSHQNLWTPNVEGDTIYIRLKTDTNVTDYGFYIDKIINGTTNTTYNWSSCSKVIGGWDVYNSDPDPYDDNGHGTHVTGIVAANGSIKGVTPDAKIIMIKALGSSGSGYSSDIIRGIEWCTNNFELYNISVISMSLGTVCYDNGTWTGYCYQNYCDIQESSYKNPINNAIKRNISVIAATGNDGNFSYISSPACIQNVTAVGATGKDDTIASYSNRNNITDLFAPGGTSGSQIVSASLNGGQRGMYGTSMATPHVAAAFALVRQFYRLEEGRILKPSEIENVLNDTGKLIDDSGSSGLNFSRINIYDAILEINEVPEISFSSPRNTTYNSLQILINITNSSDAVYVWWNNETTNITYNGSTLHTFTEGQHTIYAWANDTLGKVNSTSITFDVDTFPTISINSPQNITYNLTYGNATVLINITSSGDNIWFTNSSGQNETYTIPVYKVFNEGSNTLYVYANYSLGSENSTSVTFSINLIPSINFSSPTLKSGAYSRSDIPINVSVNDTNIDTLIIRFYNSTNLTLPQNTTYSNQSNLFLSFTSLAEGTYYFNASVNDTTGNNANTETRIILLDRTDPDVTLVKPNGDYKTSDNTPSFIYKVNDTNNIANCSLLINNEIKDTETNVSKGENKTLTSSSLSVGNYRWKIVCYDEAENSDTSTEYDLRITDDDRTTSSSSSDLDNEGDREGGDFEYEGMIYNISKTSLINATSKKLKESDILYFKIKNTEHKLTVTDVKVDYVKIKIESKPISLKMYVGDETKLNLDDDDYLDLYIKLNEIKYLIANFTLQEIHEKDTTKNETIVIEETEAKEIDLKELWNKAWPYIKIHKWWFISGGITLAVALIVGGIIYYMKRNHLKFRIVLVHYK